MAKKPSPPAIPPKRRGRPPLAGGPKTQAEVQRAYRGRLKAAGRLVMRTDPAVVGAPGIPDFDSATQMVCDREMFEGMGDRLHAALLKLERREQDVARLEARNAYLEGELRLLNQHHTNALKDNIVLKRELAKRG
jgi:hypothetical protein